MESLDKDLGALFETLTIEKTLVEPETPAFQNFSTYNPNWWSRWGSPYPISSYYKKSNSPLDIIYLNMDKKRHRLHGPAYISRAYNIREWYNNGIRHREDGPAYEHNDNSVWFKNGELHRLDGPAVVELGGPKQYWIDGVKFSKKQYNWEIKRRKRKGIL